MGPCGAGDVKRRGPGTGCGFSPFSVGRTCGLDKSRTAKGGEMRVLVTGAAGMIGRKLTERLCAGFADLFREKGIPARINRVFSHHPP